MQYLLGFAWGPLLLASFAGWGLGLRRILLPGTDEGTTDWGPAPVFGMAWVIALGGPLNLLGVLTRQAIWLLLLVGLIVFVIETHQLASRNGPARPFRWPRFVA